MKQFDPNDLDTWGRTDLEIGMMENIQCHQCKHYIGDGRCEAFPSAVPDDIFFGNHDHRTPFDGDQGVQFSPRSA